MHAWQKFDGSIVPLGQHVPPMAHVSACTVLTQTLPASSQVSSVHESESEQLRGAPTQAAELEHTSLVVQKRPSSQATPVRALQPVALRAGSHVSQPFPALTAPLA